MIMNNKKERIKSILNYLKGKDYVKKNEKIKDCIESLDKDIKEDAFIIVVVGEFKRGKSTFINALLGKSILPMDVLPETATINALQYSDSFYVDVEKKDGTKEHSRDLEFLKQFSAQSESNDFSEIKYLKIGYPSEGLKNNVVIVDTPGVSDLNEQRSDITYGFIPKANVVLFLLDATAPLKKTEKEFVEERLLPQGINNIVFIANKFDNIDEEEEDDIVQALEARIRKAFSDTNNSFLNKACLLPLSAKQALIACEKGDNSLWIKSGMPKLQSILNEMLLDEKMESQKVERYSFIIKDILNRVQEDLNNHRTLLMSDIKQLEQAQSNLKDLLNEHEEIKEKIIAFIQKEEQNFEMMTKKSLRLFTDRLIESISEMVEMYKGSDFKEYVEKQVARRISREYENWIVVYLPHIDQLIQKMKEELVLGLCYNFNCKINLRPDKSEEFSNEKILMSLNVKDISDTDIHAGVIAAASGLGLMLLAGGALMPFVSFAAMPFLRRKMLEQRLNEAKTETIPLLQDNISQMTNTLHNNIINYIHDKCSKVELSVGEAYKIALDEMRITIADAIDKKTAENINLQDKVGSLNTEINTLYKFAKEIDS